jgi:cardiolipin synthase
VQRRLFVPVSPYRPRGQINLRNHRKLVIADSERVWAGGRNIADEYFIGRAGQPPWLDLSFTAEGALALQAQALFDGDWRTARGVIWAPRLGYARRVAQREAELSAEGKPLPVPDSARPAAPERVLTRWRTQIRDRLRSLRFRRGRELVQGARLPEAPLHEPPETGPEMPPMALAQWVPSGPDFHDDTLHALLMSAAFHAERRLLLATPYFVPDEGLLEALVLAVKRGVRITLLLPAQSNHRLADWARGRAMRALAEAGAEVRLVPVMLHAKAVVVDDALALCGSANLDSRSLFINYEAMAAFYGRAEINWLADWITGTAAEGEPASPQPPAWWRDMAEGIVATLAFQL